MADAPAGPRATGSGAGDLAGLPAPLTCHHPLDDVERYVVDRTHGVFRCVCRRCGKRWIERD